MIDKDVTTIDINTFFRCLTRPPLESLGFYQPTPNPHLERFCFALRTVLLYLQKVMATKKIAFPALSRCLADDQNSVSQGEPFP